MQQTPIVLLTALGAGIAGGLAGALLASSPGAADPNTAALAAEEPSRRAAPAAEDAAEVAALRARLDVLESGPLAPVAAAPARVAAGEGAGAAAERLAALEAEVEALGLRLDALSVRTRPRAEDVAEAVEALERERRVEEIEAAKGKERASVDERVGAWGEWLDLDDSQAARLRAAFLEQGERNNELLRQWAGGADDATLGSIKEVNAQLRREEIEAILRPDQLERYRESGGAGKR